jgi:hypothetical protein
MFEGVCPCPYVCAGVSAAFQTMNESKSPEVNIVAPVTVELVDLSKYLGLLQQIETLETEYQELKAKYPSIRIPFMEAQ